ncbi:MAG: aldose 1-epimerase family protein [Coriobacteriales bacterium]|nr:aldose 1-epimerase family protein [Coriobacteriales bacterium]
MSEIITIQNGSLEASIDTAGAQLMSLKKDGGEYLWQRDPQWWPRCAPVLFPIVGNIRDDRADSAQGEIRFGRHGLARNYEFVVTDKSEDSVTLTLCSSEKTREAFPYDFKLDMTYALADGALEQRFTVTNTGDVVLPFVVGGHPAFNVPAPGCADEDFADYKLVFAKPWTYASPTINTTTGLIDFQTRFSLVEDSDTLPLTHRLFDVDTLIFEDVPERTVCMVGPSGHGMKVDFEGFDYLGVWSAANDAPFVALEPWRGTATGTDEDDVFEHKRGMDLLEAGDVAEYAFFMTPL